MARSLREPFTNRMVSLPSHRGLEKTKHSLCDWPRIDGLRILHQRAQDFPHSVVPAILIRLKPQQTVGVVVWHSLCFFDCPRTIGCESGSCSPKLSLGVQLLTENEERVAS